jgi:hypothetical protein
MLFESLVQQGLPKLRRRTPHMTKCELGHTPIPTEGFTSLSSWSRQEISHEGLHLSALPHLCSCGVHINLVVDWSAGAHPSGSHGHRTVTRSNPSIACFRKERRASRLPFLLANLPRVGAFKRLRAFLGLGVTTSAVPLLELTQPDAVRLQGFGSR